MSIFSTLRHIAKREKTPLLELITRRSLVQILPPQPVRVDVTDFSYIHLFFMPILRYLEPYDIISLG